MTRRQDELRAAALTAEQIVSDIRFRHADANGYSEETHHSIDDVTRHMASRNVATDIMFDVYLDMPRNTPAYEINWERQRRASLGKVLGEMALSPSFDMYFLGNSAKSEPSTLTNDDLPRGERDPIRINSYLLGLRDSKEDPVLFMEEALDFIGSQTALRGRKKATLAGPENYSTALKFFTDKMYLADIPPTKHGEATIRELTSEALDGFFETTKDDLPNFVEMTNLYVSFLRLPMGSIEARHTQSIVAESLKALPDFPVDTLRLMISALSKLSFNDSFEDGEAVARLLNLGLRKAGAFERTEDLRSALRISAKLPKAPATDHSLIAILGMHQSVEQSADIEDADEIVARIRSIADDVVATTAVYAALKEQIAKPAVQSARNHYQKSRLNARYTPEQEADNLTVLKRISTNYAAI